MTASARIPLRRRDGSIRAWALVDPEDFERFGGFTWSLTSGSRYAKRGGRCDGACWCVYLHRELMGLRPGDRREVDHINGNKLDYRRANLRVVAHQANQQNLRSLPGRTSKYRGVYWYRRTSKWCATVTIDGRNHHLGYFAEELDAAAAASEFRALHMPYSSDAREALQC